MSFFVGPACHWGAGEKDSGLGVTFSAKTLVKVPHPVRNFLSSLFVPSQRFSWVIMNHSDFPRITDVPWPALAMTFRKPWPLSAQGLPCLGVAAFHTGTLNEGAGCDILTLWFQAETLTNWRLYSNFWSEVVANRFELCAVVLGELETFPSAHLPPAGAPKWHFPRLSLSCVYISSASKHSVSSLYFALKLRSCFVF